jgi:hypothetical protein
MDDKYYELNNVTRLRSADDLTIRRAQALYDAVVRHRDHSVIELLQRSGSGSSTLEFLVVEVECDGVPPQNPFGIDYRERLALCVSDNPKSLVEVLALRRDFPILMHENQGVVDAPASLCLYFDSAAAVLRTWTPQNFLRRIQWWLEKSAKAGLHPADQPVEHLFFASKYELVLPWNLDELRKNKSLRFIVARGPERPD